jgi:hypothetical protein
MYVEKLLIQGNFLISEQLRRQCASLRRTVQVVWKAWLLGRLYESEKDKIFHLYELTAPQVLGHTGDEHMCSALVHMCGKV